MKSIRLLHSMGPFNLGCFGRLFPHAFHCLPMKADYKTCTLLTGPNGPFRRHFFLHWMNSVFNKYSKDRVEEVGPDRACAEWLLRNGAAVQWMGAKDFVRDYNELPLKDAEEGRFFLKTVEAVDSSIMAMGFPHFEGCDHIDKIVLRKCQYLTDEALPMLSVLKNSLKSLEISHCFNLTDTGILSLTNLSNLKTLKVEGLHEMKNNAAAEKKLKEALPHCAIHFHTETGKKSDRK